MAAMASPHLSSVLTTSNEHNDDFLHQLRNHLDRIETDVQQALTNIQQRQPFLPLHRPSNAINEKTRTHLFSVLKDLAGKNNVVLDEPLLRYQIFDNAEQIMSPKKNFAPLDRAPVTNENHETQISPRTDHRRSQFAPVLSSTPVHHTSPILSNPVESNMATPSVASVLTVNANDLPAIPPSAIVPQRANLTRTVASRPPRAPRANSASRQKKPASPIKEQTNETELIITEEVHVMSRRRIRTQQNMITEDVQVVLERNDQIIKTSVQATPLRGRKKKMIAEDVPDVSPLEVPVSVEPEVLPKPTRAARGKKKEPIATVDQEVRSSSVRQRKKEEPVVNVPEVPTSPVKKSTRGRKKTNQPVEETAPIVEVRATPSRGKKKTNTEIVPPIVALSPKITSTRSRKRKAKDEAQVTPVDTIQPPSPKRRGGRQKKSIDPPASLAPNTIVPIEIQTELPTIIPIRRSGRGKKVVEPVEEQQDENVVKKKTRGTKSKKTNESNGTEPIVADSVINTVAVKSIESLVSKPPRPPVARKKKSIAMPPISQMSPSTPPSSAQRIQSTSPIHDQLVLPVPLVEGVRRRAPRRGAPKSPTTDSLSPTVRNQKRTRSSIASTPKRARHENFALTSVLGTPGKKRRKCTCEKRRNKICDICAAAIDA